MIVTATLHAVTIWLAIVALLMATGGPAGFALLATPLGVSVLALVLVGLQCRHVRDRSDPKP